MSFTSYYYNYGFGSTMEKVAKDKEKGMGLGSKLGLGALGAAGLGAGAYYAPELLNAVGATDMGSNLAGQYSQLAHNAPAMLAQAKESAGELGDKISDKASEAKDYIQSLMSDPKAAATAGAAGLGAGVAKNKETIQDAIQKLNLPTHGADKIIPSMHGGNEIMDSISNTAKDVAKTTKDYWQPKYDAAKDYIKSEDVLGTAKDYWEPKINDVVEAMKEKYQNLSN